MAFITLSLMIVLIAFVILLVPYLGFEGLLIFLKQLNMADFISMNPFDGFF